MDNETPLHMAAQHGHTGALTTLLAHGANPNMENTRGEKVDYKFIFISIYLNLIDYFYLLKKIAIRSSSTIWTFASCTNVGKNKLVIFYIRSCYLLTFCTFISLQMFPLFCKGSSTSRIIVAV